MKRLVILTVILLLGLLPAQAREYAVSGPEGGLAMKIALPDGFNPETDKCPMVLLMHGIFSSKDYNPMPTRKSVGFRKRHPITAPRGHLKQKAAGCKHPLGFFV
jgi:hypothetical protein